MASSSSVPPNMGNVMMVTHVVPTASNGQQQPLSQRSQQFKRGQPKALGVVQIMIGIVILAFGIAMISYHQSLGVFSGIFVWGTLIYIAAGSLSVAAENSLSLCLINASLALNIMAAIVASAGTILHGLDSVIWNQSYHNHYYPGFSIVLTLLQFLELIVAITSTGYTCNATCSCCRGGQQQVMFQTVDGSFATQAPPYFTTVSVPLALPQPQGQQQVIVQTVDGAFATQAPPHFQTVSVPLAQPQPQVPPYNKSPDMDSTLPPAYPSTP